MILRFKESLWLWQTNNTIDLIIWTITTINGGISSIMMLLVSIVYWIMNIYGIVKWSVEARKNKEKIRCN